MKNLKAAVLYEPDYTGSTVCRVSVKDQMGDALLDIVSPSDLVGSGSNFDKAVDDLGKKLDNYIAQLTTFRAVLDTEDAAKESVRMDADGNLMKNDRM